MPNLVRKDAPEDNGHIPQRPCDLANPLAEHVDTRCANHRHPQCIAGNRCLREKTGGCARRKDGHFDLERVMTIAHSAFGIIVDPSNRHADRFEDPARAGLGVQHVLSRNRSTTA